VRRAGGIACNEIRPLRFENNDSGSRDMLTLDDLLREQPKFIAIGPAELEYEGLSPEVLRFIEAHVSSESATLETGSGVSTVLFAMKHTRHIAITPDANEVERVTTYCRQHKLDTNRVEFVVDSSEHALPRLAIPALDLVVIDGRHGFPAPFIDWYYTASSLKFGGLLVVDDTWTFACQILRDFLTEAPEWQMVCDFAPRAAIFKKVAEGSHAQEWVDQPYINNRGLIKYENGSCRLVYQSKAARLRKGLAHIKRGEFLTLIQKALRTLHW
jgi:methyltransferase family protein